MHTILVVEDEKAIQEIIIAILTQNGFAPIAAESVDEALAALEKHGSFDAIWLDHYLPGRKLGTDFVAIIKQHPQWKDIPVFVVSNTGGPEKFETYVRLGIAKYYVKAEHRLKRIVGEIKQYLLLPPARHPRAPKKISASRRPIQRP